MKYTCNILMSCELVARPSWDRAAPIAAWFKTAWAGKGRGECDSFCIPSLIFLLGSLGVIFLSFVHESSFICLIWCPPPCYPPRGFPCSTTRNWSFWSLGCQTSTSRTSEEDHQRPWVGVAWVGVDGLIWFHMVSYAWIWFIMAPYGLMI